MVYVQKLTIVIIALNCFAVPSSKGTLVWWNPEFFDINRETRLEQLAAIANNETARADQILTNMQKDYYNSVNTTQERIKQRVEALQARMDGGDQSCAKMDELNSLLENSNNFYNEQKQRNVVQNLKANWRVQNVYSRFASNAAFIQRSADQCRRWCPPGLYQLRLMEARRLLATTRQRLRYAAGGSTHIFRDLNAVTSQYRMELVNLGVQWRLCQDNVPVSPTNSPSTNNTMSSEPGSNSTANTTVTTPSESNDNNTTEGSTSVETTVTISFTENEITTSVQTEVDLTSSSTTENVLTTESPGTNDENVE